MDIEEILDNYKKLKKQEKENFHSDFLRLITDFNLGVSLRGPYRLVLDSSILMRLEDYQKGNISQGLLSVFLFFDFFKQCGYSADIVILPSVFYEFHRKEAIGDLKDHWDKFRAIRSVIENELKAPAFFESVQDFEEAKHYINLIEHDFLLIEKTLTEYQKKNWNFEFVTDEYSVKMVVPPFLAAEKLYEGLGLKYLNEDIVCKVFIEHIHKYLCENPYNNKDIINEYDKNTDFIMTKVLKLRGNGALEGFADVDFFSRCNLSVQFQNQAHGNYCPASIGLTIDKKLSKGMSRYSSLHIGSEVIVSGKNNLDVNKVKPEMFLDEGKRLDEADSRQSALFSNFDKYVIDNIGDKFE